MRQKMENNICLACLATNKKLKNSYCSKCIKELFDGTVPNPLNFNKVEFTKKELNYHLECQFQEFKIKSL